MIAKEATPLARMHEVTLTTDSGTVLTALRYAGEVERDEALTAMRKSHEYRTGRIKLRIGIVKIITD